MARERQLPQIDPDMPTRQFREAVRDYLEVRSQRDSDADNIWITRKQLANALVNAGVIANVGQLDLSDP